MGPESSSGRRKRRRIAPLAGIVSVTMALAGGASAHAATTRLTFVTNLQSQRSIVWVANADGTHRTRLGSGSDAAISPSGTSVAVVGRYGRHGVSLYARSVGGAGGRGPARKLLHAGQTLFLSGWSQDGTHVAAIVNEARLVVCDVATGACTTIARGQIQGASFSPAGDRIVYGRSASSRLSSRVNLIVAGIDGSGAHAITHDGRSLMPVWGPQTIAFTHERLRARDAPVYQLRTASPDGSGVKQLTHMKIPQLVSGLTPTQFSDDGTRLLAEYVGQDTSEAWTVNLRSGKARDLTGRRDSVIGAGLAGDGRSVLVQRGSFEDPLHQSVATIPFGGGKAKVLVRHGSEPSWNR